MGLIEQNGFDLERERSSCQLSSEKPRIWEFLTASLEEKSSFQNSEVKNFASLESRFFDNLVYLQQQKFRTKNTLQFGIWF